VSGDSRSDDVPVLHFDEGLPGFPDAHRFTLVPIGADSDGGLFRMMCLDADVQFVVAAPPVFLPDYAPEIDDDAADRLGLATTDDAITLLVVTLADPLDQSTVNLLAPIVVNVRTREAAQFVLRSDVLPIRQLLVAV